MDKTQKYQLSQWEKTDRIMMEDFNGDNAKVEAALAALAAADSRTSSRFYTGSYVGTGGTGGVTVYLPRRPLFVMISGVSENLFYLSPNERIMVQPYNSNSVSNSACSLSGGALSWKTTYCNRAGTTYYVFAILEA